jgi:hypothetical protein
MMFGYWWFWFLVDSFAQHFCDDENQKSAAKAASKQQVDQRIANGGEHRGHGCDHYHFKFGFILVKSEASWDSRALCFSLVA